MSATIRVRFVDHDTTVDAAVGDSILELAEQHDVALDHACGGVCACSTCHVKVLAGAEFLSAATEEEEDQLDQARDLDLTSRLGCQARILAVPGGDTTIEATIDIDIDIAIPTWNINLVQEGD